MQNHYSHGDMAWTPLQRFPNCASMQLNHWSAKHVFAITSWLATAMHSIAQQCNCWSLKQELSGTRAARATSHAQEIFEWNYEGDIQTFDDSMSNGAWHHESCKSPKAHCRWIGCWMFDHHSVATLENACLCEARSEIQQILVGVVWTFGWAWDFPYWEILKYYCHDRDHWILVIEVLFLYCTFTVLHQARKPAPFITLSTYIHHPGAMKPSFWVIGTCSTWTPSMTLNVQLW